MVEVILEGLAKDCDEATLQIWFYEEGDVVQQGDDIVELVTEDGKITIAAPESGVLAEVYYEEGELVAKGEVLCTIDDKTEEVDEDEDDESDEEDDKDGDEDEKEEEEEVNEDE